MRIYGRRLIEKFVVLRQKTQFTAAIFFFFLETERTIFYLQIILVVNDANNDEL